MFQIYRNNKTFFFFFNAIVTMICQGWVRDMYTAVSLVQAKNSENAKQVGDAMQRHAEIGRNARLKYEQLLERQQQHQQQRPPPPPALHPQPPGYIGASSVAGGGEAPEARGAGDKTPGNGVAGYVLKDDGNDSERLNGYVGMDATRQVRGNFSCGERG